MPEASPLLDFLLTHEESFKSRARLASLYSDFRAQAQTNPDGYQANVSAWKKALEDAARAGLLPGGNLLAIRTGEELVSQLQLERWGRPGALGCVVEDALARGDFIPLKDFMQQRHSIYSRSRLTPWRLASWALSWGMQQVGLGATAGSGTDKLAAGEFVIKANVEAAAAALMLQLSKEHVGSGPGLIYSRTIMVAKYAQCYGSSALSERDMDLLLTHMSRDMVSCAYDSQSGTVRFLLPNKSISTYAEAGSITESEIAIARLKTLIFVLDEGIPALDARVAALDKEARQAVAEKKTANARSALRSKKHSNDLLEKRRSTLLQLQDVYGKIETAASNVEIVKAMEASAGVLRALNKEVGGTEGAEKVADKLRDEMDTADEINVVLGEQVGAGAVDDAAVEEEFEQLERAERERLEADKKGVADRRVEQDAELTRRRLAELDMSKDSLPAVGAEGKPEVKEPALAS